MLSKEVAVPVELEKIIKYKERKRPIINKENAIKAIITILLIDLSTFEVLDKINPRIKNVIPADIEANTPNAELRILSIFSVLSRPGVKITLIG